jgi:hypothetical protein
VSAVAFISSEAHLASPQRPGAAFYGGAVRILSEVDLSAEILRSGAGKAARKITIGTVYPATIGVLPAFVPARPLLAGVVWRSRWEEGIRDRQRNLTKCGFFRQLSNRM